MGWLNRTINSSIGKKTVMAISGLLLGIFIAGHLLGNAQIFRGRGAYETYAGQLRSLGGWLPAAELFLALTFMVHSGFGLLLFLENRQAQPGRYTVARSAGGRTWGSRTIPYTGLWLLLFLFYHLASRHFASPEPLSDWVRANLSQPLIGSLYLAAILALTLHLSHGMWSLCQSLGISHPKYDRFLEYSALGASVFIGALFGLIPLLALFWPDFLR